jgi:hypothetical protein
MAPQKVSIKNIKMSQNLMTDTVTVDDTDNVPGEHESSGGRASVAAGGRTAALRLIG